MTKKISRKKIYLTDLYRYFGKNNWRIFWKGFCTIPGFKYSYYLRKAWLYKDSGVLRSLCYLYAKIMLVRYRYKFGFEISEDTEIGPGFYLGHFGGVVINPKTIIGCNVNIAHGVTIGKIQRGEKAGTPVIGDNVWIGPNAVIVGKIRIDRGALIAPGAYVNFDVPENGVVLGNPGKIVSSEGATDKYATNLFPLEDYEQ